MHAVSWGFHGTVMEECALSRGVYGACEFTMFSRCFPGAFREEVYTLLTWFRGGFMVASWGCCMGFHGDVHGSLMVLPYFHGAVVVVYALPHGAFVTLSRSCSRRFRGAFTVLSWRCMGFCGAFMGFFTGFHGAFVGVYAPSWGFPEASTVFSWAVYLRLQIVW